MLQTVESLARKLTVEDVRGPDGMTKLYELSDAALGLPDPRRSVPVLIETLERLGSTHLGSPGPLVHAVEEIGGYEDELHASVLRRPNRYTLWMVNRILNGPADSHERERWMGVLRTTYRRANLDESLRKSCLGYLQTQGEAPA